MERNTRVLLTGAIVASLLAALLLAVPPAPASDFGSEDRFDSPKVERDFNLPSTKQDTTKRDRERKQYSLHDQLIRVIFLLAFMGVAGLTVKIARYKHRKIILIASVVVLGLYLGGFLCPFTAVQNLFTKWQTGYLLLFLVVLVSAVLWGRAYCGYICPFGAIQELLHFKRISRVISSAWDRYLSKAKYALLGYLVVRVLITSQVILQDYDPFKALFAWGGTPLSIGLTVGFAILSMTAYRPYCRYVCPLGAFLALLSRFCLSRIRIDEHCVDCGVCEKVCRFRAIAGKPPTIDPSECILCGDCLEKCAKGAIVTARTRISNLFVAHPLPGAGSIE